MGLGAVDTVVSGNILLTSAVEQSWPAASIVRGDAWPAEARRVMQQAGLEPEMGQLEYGDARARPK